MYSPSCIFLRPKQGSSVPPRPTFGIHQHAGQSATKQIQESRQTHSARMINPAGRSRSLSSCHCIFNGNWPISTTIYHTYSDTYIRDKDYTVVQITRRPKDRLLMCEALKMGYVPMVDALSRWISRSFVWVCRSWSHLWTRYRRSQRCMRYRREAFRRIARRDWTMTGTRVRS